MNKKHNNNKHKVKNDGAKKYMRNLRKDILDVFVFNPTKTYTTNQVGSVLKIKDRSLISLIREVMKDEVSKGNLLLNDEKKYQYIKPQKNYVEGRIDITKSGRGFIIVDGVEDDIPVSREDTGTALNGDIVQVSINPRSKNVRGKVEKVVKRARDQYVGIIEQSKAFAFFLPSNAKIHVDFFIPKSGLNGAKDGEKVIVELVDWSYAGDKPEAKVVKVLGKPGNNDVEMHAIMVEYGLPYDFPEEVEREAEKISQEISEEEIKKRKDFREVLTFTIDPHDAKDFDDALSYQKLENGNTEVGIHIADVSHYLRKKTILDDEAVYRATSVYLVDRTVPMLPEILSNKLCSLRPNEDKLCFSAVFEINDKAEVVKQWIGRTVIHSDRRFTYEEAQERIEGSGADLAEEILELNRLARIMREKRFDDGAIDFHSEEVRFNLDEDGKPISVYVKVMKEANQLIEEFMLLANQKVSAFIGDPPKGHPKTFVYRIHADPDPEKLRTLREYVMKFGLKMEKPTSDNAAQILKALLKQVKGTKEEAIVQPLAIRSMAKAVYSTDNVGHFGLGFDFYSHFTSPIRRYPDVMVHRLLEQYLDGGKSANADDYEKLSKYCSDQEKKAQDAEWASIKYKQVEYMHGKIGQQFQGVISGITGWGLYIELTESKCEGMARLEDMKDDYYSFDEKEYVVKGKKHGQEYHLGDVIEIVVKDADLLKRQLDFEVVS